MSDISLTLKHDEALILFEWLASLEEKALHNVCDEAEQKVLWQIEAQLESQLPDILMSDYAARVAAAKGRV